MDRRVDQAKQDADGLTGSLDPVAADRDMAATAGQVDGDSADVDVVVADPDAAGLDVVASGEADGGAIRAGSADPVALDGQAVDTAEREHLTRGCGRNHVAGNGHVPGVHPTHAAAGQSVPTEPDAAGRGPLLVPDNETATASVSCCSVLASITRSSGAPAPEGSRSMQLPVLGFAISM